MGDARPVLVPLAVALVAALAACSGGSSPAAPTKPVTPAAAATTGPASSSSSSSSSGPAATGPVVPTTVPPGAKPAVDLELALRSTSGAPDVRVDVDASGFAPRGRGDAGPLAAVQDVRVDYGDGVQADVGGRADVLCGKRSRLGVLALRQSVEHTYARPGSYTLTVDVVTCRPGSAAARATSRDLEVVVTAPPAGAQGVTLDVRPTSPAGARQLVLGVTASGTAPRGAGAAGGAGAALMGVAVDFGDGTLDDGPATAPGCDAAAAPGPLRFTDERKHTYVKAGTYTVTYTLLTCAPGAATTTPTTRTLKVTVR